MFKGTALFTKRSGGKLKSMTTQRVDEPREHTRGLLSGLTEKWPAMAPKDNSVLM